MAQQSQELASEVIPVSVLELLALDEVQKVQVIGILTQSKHRQAAIFAEHGINVENLHGSTAALGISRRLQLRRSLSSLRAETLHQLEVHLEPAQLEDLKHFLEQCRSDLLQQLEGEN